MIKIKVDEEVEDIKNKLAPIKEKICIVNKIKGGGKFIVAYNSSKDFIKKNLTVTSIEEFTEKQKVKIFFSDDYADIEIIGREDFLS